MSCGLRGRDPKIIFGDDKAMGECPRCKEMKLIRRDSNWISSVVLIIFLGIFFYVII
jgi:hypothetical protein